MLIEATAGRTVPTRLFFAGGILIGIQEAGRTTRFMVKYEDSADPPARDELSTYPVVVTNTPTGPQPGLPHDPPRGSAE